MKRRLLILGLALALGGVFWAADGALVSLSYLEGIFSDQVGEAVEERLDEADKAALDSALRSAREAAAAAEAVAGGSYAGSLAEVSLNEGDTLTGPTGLVCLPLAGSIRADFSSGAVVDVTAGAEVASGAVLTADHKYIVAEDTTARFTVVSQTAVLRYEGYYAFSYGDGVDYVSMADALKLLNLFQGSDTAYGGGYNLDRPPTRLQALVMFLRVMGEEEAALAYTGSHPFTDVRWGDSYVAYAVDRGYTDGVSPDRFGADSPASAVMFMEFLLRAMGYSQVGVDNWATALERAELLGCITRGEYDLLKNGAFTRAQVVYLSYYSLDTGLPDGETLAERLVEAGVFTENQLRTARAMISSQRLA